MAERAPSTGKTVAIALAVPAALEDVLYTTLHDIWGYDWATPRFIASLVFLAGSLASIVIHMKQREKENAEPPVLNGVTGGPNP